MTKKRNRVRITLGDQKNLKILLIFIALLIVLLAFPFIRQLFALFGSAVTGPGGPPSLPSGPLPPSYEPSTLPTGPPSSVPLPPIEQPKKPVQPPPTSFEKKLLKERIKTSYDRGSGRLILSNGIIRLEVTLPPDKLDTLLNSEIGTTDILLSDTSNGNKQAAYIATENVPLLKQVPAHVTISKRVKNVNVVALRNFKEYHDFLRLGTGFLGLRSVGGVGSQLPADTLCSDCVVSYGSATMITLPRGFSSGYGFAFDDLASGPIQGKPILNASTPLNLTTDDLFCNAREFFDIGGNPVFGEYAFEKNGQPVEVLALTFDTQQTNAGENTTDFSFHRFNASLGNALQTSVPTWVGSSEAALGGAYFFDGVDDVITVLRHSGVLDFASDDFTLEGWIKPLPSPTIVTKYSLVSKSLAGPRYILSYNAVAENLEFVLSDGTNTATLTSNANSVPLGAYTHFAVTIDRGNQATFFINGVPAGSASISSVGNIANTVPLAIGTGADTPFYGVLDELRLYLSALSTDQLREHGNKRYWIIADEETNQNDVWRCMVTPTNLIVAGDGNFSNALTVAARRVNNPPTHTTPLLLGETLRNRSIEDLTCLNQTTADIENDPIANIFHFAINGGAYAALHLPFEGHVNANQYAIDYSTSARRADVSNAVFGAQGGVVGSAYTFRSALNSFLNTSSSPDFIFDPDENVTLEVWIQTTDPDGVIIGKQAKLTRDLQPGDSAYSLRVSGGYPRFEFTDNFAPPGMRSLTGLTRVDTGVFRHLVVVKNKKTNSVTLFVDGIQEASLPDTQTRQVGNNAADFVIGALNKSEEFFDGTIDEVRVYRRALSLSEIDSHKQLNYSVVKGTETLRGESWTCAVTPSDGFDAGTTRTSRPLVIRNTEPMHDLPLLVSSSSLGLDSDNLTCANQNTHDADGDPVVNVFDFVVNSRPFTMLQLPFLPHEETATKVIDYSKAANGTISGATFSPIGSRSSYFFDALDDNIIFGENYYNTSNTLSIEAIIRLISFKENATIVAKSRQSPQDVAFAFRTGDRTRPDELQLLWGIDGRINIMTTTNANLFLNRWHHVVVRKVPGSQPQFFVDGVPKTLLCPLGNCAAPLRTARGGVAIGRDFSTNDNTVFSGYIGYIAVYNRSLSNDLIMEHNFSRYEFMPHIETAPGQLWACKVTPNDGFVDGVTLESSAVNITAVRVQQLRGGGEAGQSGTRLPNYTFNVRTQQSATYTLMPNHKIRILGVGRGDIFTLVFDRGLISRGLFGQDSRKRAILFLIPTIGTIEMEEGSFVHLDLDRRGGYDITLKILSVEEFAVKLELLVFGFDSTLSLSGPSSPFGFTLPPGVSVPQAIPAVTPSSYRLPVVEEPTFAADRPKLNYTAIGVVVLLIAIVVILIIMIRKLKI